MNKAEAQREFEKIIQEVNEKCDIIEREAKENGIWKSGLDSNKSLFEEVNNEARKK